MTLDLDGPRSYSEKQGFELKSEGRLGQQRWEVEG